MTLRVQDAGALRTITSGRVKVAGVMRPLLVIKAMDGGALRTVASFIGPLSVTAGATSGNGSGITDETVTTRSTTAVVSGGLSPLTYAWVLLTNGGGNASTATAPTLASTAFTKANVPVDTVVTDTWRITATDSLGSSAIADISVTFRNLSTGGTL